MPVYALIGNPLGHSFSKSYFNSKFEREGLCDYSYINLELQNLDEIHQQIQLHNLSGFNVTIPFKERILDLLNWISPDAKQIGAVNTVKISDGKLLGFNTDYLAFMETLKPKLKPYHTSALILGTGGASKAVSCALKFLGIEFRFVSRIKHSEKILTYSQLTSKDVRNAPLIINTTPLGTFPSVSECPDIPYEGIDKYHLLYDLVYNPPQTSFLSKGMSYGADTVNGHSMLIRQAEDAWKIWTDDSQNTYLSTEI